jgi:hypothetical protein
MQTPIVQLNLYDCVAKFTDAIPKHGIGCGSKVTFRIAAPDFHDATELAAQHVNFSYTTLSFDILSVVWVDYLTVVSD